MIYRFKDLDRSLALALPPADTVRGGVNFIRNKSEGFDFEVLIEKKTNAKFTGFAHVVNFLCGFQPTSGDSDFVNWLVNQADLRSNLCLDYCFAHKGKHPLVEAVIFVTIRKHKLAVEGDVKQWFESYQTANQAKIDTYYKNNDAQPVDAKKAAPEKKVETAPGADKKEDKKHKEKKVIEITEDYKQKVFTQKLTRVNKSEVVLPKEGEQNVLVTSALPYVNNVPHLGNLIGAVLSADVFARYSRLRGNNTLYICGTDMYGSASEIKGIQEGKPPGEVAEHFHKLHEQIYADFEIDFDYFGKTATPKHTEIVQDIFLKDSENGFFTKKSSEEYFSKRYNIGLADRFIVGTCPFCGYDQAGGDQCDKCGKLQEPEKLINPKCALSGEAPERRSTEHFYLDLTTLEKEVKEFIHRASVEGKWSPNSIAISEGWLKTGLLPRSMTRDLNWGVPVPGAKNKVFYVWFDAPIGYPSITANYTDHWAKWWKNPENVRLFQFMGKDNVPFHTVMFPASLIGTRENWTLLHHISTTEYLNYESGKFSKSKNRGVFGNQVRELPYQVSCWRYYLLINRPENSDSQFQWSDFQSKVNDELLTNPGNLVNRVLTLVYQNYNQKTTGCKVQDLIEYETFLTSGLMLSSWTKSSTEFKLTPNSWTEPSSRMVSRLSWSSVLCATSS